MLWYQFRILVIIIVGLECFQVLIDICCFDCFLSWINNCCVLFLENKDGKMLIDIFKGLDYIEFIELVSDIICLIIYMIIFQYVDQLRVCLLNLNNILRSKFGDEVFLMVKQLV